MYWRWLSSICQHFSARRTNLHIVISFRTRSVLNSGRNQSLILCTSVVYRKLKISFYRLGNMLRFLRKGKNSCAFPLCYDLVVILNKGFIKGSRRDRDLKESNRLISKVIFKKLYYTGSYYFNEK